MSAHIETTFAWSAYVVLHGVYRTHATNLQVLLHLSFLVRSAVGGLTRLRSLYKVPSTTCKAAKASFGRISVTVETASTHP